MCLKNNVYNIDNFPRLSTTDKMQHNVILLSGEFPPHDCIIEGIAKSTLALSAFHPFERVLWASDNKPDTNHFRWLVGR